MKNKIIFAVLIVFSVTIGIIIIYPEIKDFTKVKEDNRYYQSMLGLVKDKEQEEDSAKNNLSELESLNSKTNEAKKEIERLTKLVEEKNNKVKELDNSIKKTENNIKYQKNEKERIQNMFE